MGTPARHEVFGRLKGSAGKQFGQAKSAEPDALNSVGSHRRRDPIPIGSSCSPASVGEKRPGDRRVVSGDRRSIDRSRCVIGRRGRVIADCRSGHDGRDRGVVGRRRLTTATRPTLSRSLVHESDRGENHHQPGEKIAKLHGRFLVSKGSGHRPQHAPRIGAPLILGATFRQSQVTVAQSPAFELRNRDACASLYHLRKAGDASPRPRAVMLAGPPHTPLGWCGNFRRRLRRLHQNRICYPGRQMTRCRVRKSDCHAGRR